MLDKDGAMLVLNRKTGERVVIGDRIEVTILEVRGDRVKLGIEGPDDVTIYREELYRKIAEAAKALPPQEPSKPVE